MSQAEDLLNSLTDEQIALYSAEVSEPHIVIGVDRKIIVPERLKRIAVQYDHNIETVTFDCPRYWDEHDLSTMPIYINYKRADNVLGSYIAENVKVDPNDDTILHFTWTISRNITNVKGGLVFLVCAKSVELDGEGNEKVHWNTELNTDLSVSEGLETSVIAEEEYPDIVSQLLARMDVVEQINVKSEEIQQALADTIDAKNAAIEASADAEDFVDTAKTAYANAIKGSARGEVVRVDDVSPAEHSVKVQVVSKNLIPFPYKISSQGAFEETRNGITTTITSDGVITLNGTCDEDMAIALIKNASIPVSGKYTLSGITNGGDTTCYLQAYIDKVYQKTITTAPVTFTWDGNLTQLSIYVKKGAVLNNVEIKPQLEIGETATEYVPYVDPSTVSVKAYGKNLFPVTLGTYNGVTLSKVDDYYVLNGTATGSGLFITKIGYLPAGTYTVSANNPKHNDLGSIFVPIVQLYSPDTLSSIAAIDDRVNSTATATIKAGANYETRIRYQEGVTYNNFIIKPQLEYGSVATEYEEYYDASYGPATDGLISVTSISPDMTIVTGADNALVDVEYNVDSETYIKDNLSTRLAKFVISGANTPTYKASDYPNIGLGDVVVNESYRAWICLYKYGDVVSWGEIITNVGNYLFDQFYSKTQIDQKLAALEAKIK